MADSLESARALAARKDRRAALAMLRRMISAGDTSEGVVVFALKCASRAGEWRQAIEIADDALRQRPCFHYALRGRGEALLRTDRLDEAIVSLRAALDAHSDDSEARALLELATSPRPTAAAPIARSWPGRQDRFSDPETLIRSYVLRGMPRGGFVRPDSQFLTLGSCFANNLAQRLEATGLPVSHFPVGEEINSTYANLHMLKWLAGERDQDATKTIGAVLGVSGTARMSTALQRTDVVILTLGLAAAQFRRDTGEFGYFMGQTGTAREMVHATYELRTGSVAENAENLREIVRLLNQLAPDPTVVLTVSPVPLIGSTEFASAVEADCISKSTLRLACHEAMNALGSERLWYWPSFEIVRWLGANFGASGRPAYGSDGNSRHVSDWLIQLIIDAFLDHHAA